MKPPKRPPAAKGFTLCALLLCALVCLFAGSGASEGRERPEDAQEPPFSRNARRAFSTVSRAASRPAQACR